MRGEDNPQKTVFVRVLVIYLAGTGIAKAFMSQRCVFTTINLSSPPPEVIRVIKGRPPWLVLTHILFQLQFIARPSPL